MKLKERMELLVVRLEDEGRYTDANIVWQALDALDNKARPTVTEVPAEDRCRQEEKM